MEICALYFRICHVGNDFIIRIYRNPEFNNQKSARYITNTHVPQDCGPFSENSGFQAESSGIILSVSSPSYVYR